MRCKNCGEECSDIYCSATCYLQRNDGGPMIKKLREADPRFEDNRIQFVIKLLLSYPVNKHAILLQAFIDTANTLKIAESKLIELAQKGVKI